MDTLDDRRRREALEKTLLGDVGRAIQDFDLVEEGDRILVGVSGGKDSFTLLHLLSLLRRRAPVRFELVAVTLDQGQPGFDPSALTAWMAREGHDFHLLREDTYSVVVDKIPEGKTYCSLCSRLRRGVLYNAAVRMGCNKIALGHHRDDLVETLFLNLLYAGQIKSMAPRLTSDDGRNVVIRPLAYAAERDIAAYASLLRFPIVPCNLCGSQDGLKRARIKRLLAQLEGENDKVMGNLVAALGSVVPTHLLDRALLRRLTGEDPPEASPGRLRIPGP